MAKKAVTTEDLARMVKEGFDNTATKGELGLLRVETKDGLNEVKRRLDRIEYKMIEKHEHRIEMLEERVKEIGSALSI